MCAPMLHAHESSSAAEFPRRLEAARRGNRAAQSALFERYYSQVERIVHAQLRRKLGKRRLSLSARFSTADVVQDVFQLLLSSLGDFRGTSEAQFVAYVVRIIERRTLDVIRHHGASCRDYRRHQVDAGLIALNSAAPQDASATQMPSDLLRRYGSALQSLPEQARGLLRGRLERGLGFEVLAHELGYSSRYAARRAFFAAQARLIVRMKSAAN